MFWLYVIMCGYLACKLIHSGTTQVIFRCRATDNLIRCAFYICYSVHNLMYHFDNCRIQGLFGFTPEQKWVNVPLQMLHIHAPFPQNKTDYIGGEFLHAFVKAC